MDEDRILLDPRTYNIHHIVQGLLYPAVPDLQRGAGRASTDLGAVGVGHCLHHHHVPLLLL